MSNGIEVGVNASLLDGSTSLAQPHLKARGLLNRIIGSVGVPQVVDMSARASATERTTTRRSILSGVSRPPRSVRNR